MGSKEKVVFSVVSLLLVQPVITDRIMPVGVYGIDRSPHMSVSSNVSLSAAWYADALGDSAVQLNNSGEGDPLDSIFLTEISATDIKKASILNGGYGIAFLLIAVGAYLLWPFLPVDGIKRYIRSRNSRQLTRKQDKDNRLSSK